MLTLTGSAAYVALVQTAAGLPVVLFAIVAGRSATWWTGAASCWPRRRSCWSRLLARAIGPAIGGALLAATSSGTVFLVNAASFAAVLAVLTAWHSTRAPDTLPREHVGEAIRAGGRYISASPVLRVILARAGLFIVFASAIWALLPLTAESALHLGASGYGLLLGSVGIGAVAGAALLPRLRARLSPDALLAAGSIGMAAVTLLLAYAHVTAVAAVALVVGGACWILALSTSAGDPAATTRATLAGCSRSSSSLPGTTTSASTSA